MTISEYVRSSPWWGVVKSLEYYRRGPVALCVNQEATKVIARVKRIAGVLGVPSRSTLGEGRVDIAALELTMIELPGVGEDGMPGQNG